MLKSKLIQTSLAGFATLAFSPISGVAIAHDNHQYNHHGNGYDHHSNHDRYWCYEYGDVMDVQNSNNIDVKNMVEQSSSSGSVDVEKNTTTGHIHSGAGSNDQDTSISMNLNNSASLEHMNEEYSHDHHDEHEHNYHTATTYRNGSTEIKNMNNVEVTNSIKQTATSGDVSVHHNTTVGDVSSGSAMNTSTSMISITTNN